MEEYNIFVGLDVHKDTIAVAVAFSRAVEGGTAWDHFERQEIYNIQNTSICQGDGR